jgi:hypothetical protein
MDTFIYEKMERFLKWTFQSDENEVILTPTKQIYQKEILNCERLILKNPVVFNNCCFPNLRQIELLENIAMPFIECRFNHALNLKITPSISWILPNNIVVRSIETEAEVELATSEDTFYFNKPEYHPVEVIFDVHVQCGSSPNRSLFR